MLGLVYRIHIAGFEESVVCGVEADWRGTGDTCGINRVKSLDPSVSLSQR